MERRAPTLFWQVIAGFAGGFLLLAGVGLVSIRVFDASRAERDASRRAVDLRDGVAETLSILKDVETGARGYALTRDRRYLEPFVAGQAALEGELARLQVLVESDRARAAKLAEFSDLARRRAALSRLYVARLARPFPPEERVRLMGRGKETMDRARAAAAALAAAETSVEVLHRERYQRLAREASAAIYASLALSLVLFGGAGLLIDREIRARERMAERVRASRAQLQSILDHTPAVVYIKDGEGRYVLTNRRLERIFARSGRSLLGRSDAELWPEEIARVLRANDERVLKTGQVLECEETVPHQDGPHTYFTLKFPLPGVAERLVCGVSMDISERKRIEAMKSEVVALASHELRTPLSVIHGSLRYLLGEDDPASAPDMRELLEMSLRSTRHMLAVVNNYLDLAAIESGETPLETRDLDLGALVSEAAEAARGLGAERGLRVGVRTPAAPVLARGDAERISEVLQNLLSNAAKYSPEGGEIEVAVEPLGEAVRVSIRDHGPGIRAEFRDRVFARFARDAARRPEGAKGTGLGLSIAKALVERMGGAIGFETREGDGTTFWFALPAARVSAGAERLSEAASSERRGGPGSTAGPGTA